jgi:hypothetical protein
MDFRFAVGPTAMSEVRRLRPGPETRFWDSAILATLHASVGLEAEVLPDFTLFLDAGLRLYSAPSEAAESRPANEVGFMYFAIWQAGFFFRF